MNNRKALNGFRSLFSYWGLENLTAFPAVYRWIFLGLVLLNRYYLACCLVPEPHRICYVMYLARGTDQVHVGRTETFQISLGPDSRILCNFYLKVKFDPFLGLRVKLGVKLSFNNETHIKSLF